MVVFKPFTREECIKAQADFDAEFARVRDGGKSAKGARMGTWKKHRHNTNFKGAKQKFGTAGKTQKRSTQRGSGQTGKPVVVERKKTPRQVEKP